MRILIIVAIFIGGCATSQTSTISESNKDVLILSLLVQDYLRNSERPDTNNLYDMLDTNVPELLQLDTLNRISISFEKVELKAKGGHISLYDKFSELRDSKGVKLSDKEKDQTKYFRWKEKNLKNEYDGEVQFQYGERFYRVIKIVTASKR